MKTYSPKVLLAAVLGSGLAPIHAGDANYPRRVRMAFDKLKADPAKWHGEPVAFHAMAYAIAATPRHRNPRWKEQAERLAADFAKLPDFQAIPSRMTPDARYGVAFVPLPKPVYRLRFIDEVLGEYPNVEAANLAAWRNLRDRLGVTTEPVPVSMPAVNKVRARSAGRALDAYRQAKKMGAAEPKETAVTDLLSDLRHYCARWGIDFERRVWMSGQHFSAESPAPVSPAKH